MTLVYYNGIANEIFVIESVESRLYRCTTFFTARRTRGMGGFI
jgi:hypothetical protein